MINKKIFIVILLLFMNFVYAMEECEPMVLEDGSMPSNYMNVLDLPQELFAKILIGLDSPTFKVVFCISKAWKNACLSALPTLFNGYFSHISNELKNSPESYAEGNPVEMDAFVMRSLLGLRNIYKFVPPSDRQKFSLTYFNSERSQDLLQSVRGNRNKFPTDSETLPRLLVLLVIQQGLGIEIIFPRDKDKFWTSLFKNEAELKQILESIFNCNYDDPKNHRMANRIGQELSQRGCHHLIPDFRKKARELGTITARKCLETLCGGWLNYWGPKADIIETIAKEMIKSKSIEEGEELDPEIKAFVAFFYLDKKKYKKALELYEDIKAKNGGFHDTYYYILSVSGDLESNSEFCSICYEAYFKDRKSIEFNVELFYSNGGIDRECYDRLIKHWRVVLYVAQAVDDKKISINLVPYNIYNDVNEEVTKRRSITWE